MKPPSDVCVSVCYAVLVIVIAELLVILPSVLLPFLLYVPLAPLSPLLRFSLFRFGRLIGHLAETSLSRPRLVSRPLLDYRIVRRPALEVEDLHGGCGVERERNE